MPDSSFKDMATSIRGPVYPICPAFTADGALDLDATASYVSYLVDNGARYIMTTAGTSRFNLLSDQEIMDLNACVVTAAGDAMTFVGNSMNGGTETAKEFAVHARDAGADVLLVFYPERFYGNDDVCEYYADVAAVVPELGIMIHAWPMRAAAPTSGPTAPFSVPLVRMMCDIPNFVGMKEEHSNENLRYDLVTAFGEELSFIVAGSAMAMYASCAPYGVTTYLTSVGSFKPEIEEDFYAAHAAGRYDDAMALIHKYEDPFFAVAKPAGWHLAMKATLDLMGLMPKHERPPLKPLSEDGRKPIADVLSSFGWV